MNRHAKLVTEEFNKRAINPGKSKKSWGWSPELGLVENVGTGEGLSPEPEGETREQQRVRQPAAPQWKELEKSTQ